MSNEVTTTINPEHKDRLFKFIFGKETDQSKHWRLQLYNALNGTNIQDPDALKINTIENIIYITMHNDISFLVDTDMNLYEQQSSWNPNMPLRGLFYFAILYQQYLSNNDMNILSEKLIQIPTPKFYVFYHGTKEDGDSWKMRLSDAFLTKDNNGDFEWTAKVINLHPKHNTTLNKSCIPLYHYVKFVSMITENKKSGMDKKEAVEKAVDNAIKEKLLDGFFKIHRAEVIGMCMTEYDEEEFKRICRKDGYIDGRSEMAEEGAINLLRMGILTPEQIAQAQGLTVEKVLELQKSITVTA